MTINSTLVGGAGCSAGVPAVADTDDLATLLLLPTMQVWTYNKSIHFFVKQKQSGDI